MATDVTGTRWRDVLDESTVEEIRVACRPRHPAGTSRTRRGEKSGMDDQPPPRADRRVHGHRDVAAAVGFARDAASRSRSAAVAQRRRTALVDGGLVIDLSQ